MFRRKKLVRVHLKSGPTLQGALIGRWLGHYILLSPKYVEGEDRTVPFESQRVEVPTENVHFYEVTP
jgi:hypothetical protein